MWYCTCAGSIVTLLQTIDVHSSRGLGGRSMHKIYDWIVGGLLGCCSFNWINGLRPGLLLLRLNQWTSLFLELQRNVLISTTALNSCSYIHSCTRILLRYTKTSTCLRSRYSEVVSAKLSHITVWERVLSIDYVLCNVQVDSTTISVATGDCNAGHT